jgi:phosphoglycerate dehydrogenase-like enzyme
MVENNLVAIEPKSFPEYEQAVTAAGAVVTKMSEDVRGVIWTDYSAPDALGRLLQNNPQLQWVQLPFAGVDAFKNLLDAPVRFTSAKGSYREPVAEHALTLALALGRKLPIRIKASAWGKREAFSFYDSKVLIVGGGGICQELISLLKAFRPEITVVRNDATREVEGANKVVSIAELDDHIGSADLVVIACALTDQTRGLFDLDRLRKMKATGYLVNVARGPIVVSEDLLKALDSGYLAGAALDVTDPEPLPAGHPFFLRDDLIITPHTADTKEIVTRLFALRIKENVAAFLGNGEWVGQVNPTLGY